MLASTFPIEFGGQVAYMMWFAIVLIKYIIMTFSKFLTRNFCILLLLTVATTLVHERLIIHTNLTTCKNLGSHESEILEILNF